MKKTLTNIFVIIVLGAFFYSIAWTVDLGCRVYEQYETTPLPPDVYQVYTVSSSNVEEVIYFRVAADGSKHIAQSWLITNNVPANR